MIIKKSKKGIGIKIEKLWKQGSDQKQVREWKKVKDEAQSLLYAE